MSYYDPITYIVKLEEDGLALKTILRARMQLSRKLLSKLKMTDHGITIDGQRVYTSIKVRAGAMVEVRMAKEHSEDILPQPLDFDILFEDEHLLVVNKAAGMIVHPTHGHYTNTLANAVVYYWANKGERFRFRPVHRLDQHTSGVLAIAKNPFAHQQIAMQFQQNLVHKQYIGIAHGLLNPSLGTIDAPIRRDEDNPHIRVTKRDGSPSITHYQSLQTYKDASLVQLILETGRTHQIRVHLQHIGHPLIGDAIYTDKQYTNDPYTAIVSRHALHAQQLCFMHPVERKRLVFEAPLPDDMNKLIEMLTISRN